MSTKDIQQTQPRPLKDPYPWNPQSFFALHLLAICMWWVGIVVVGIEIDILTIFYL